MSERFTIVDLDDVASESFPESGLPHQKLTEPLQCTQLRINAVTLEPGQQTAPHSHEGQEELYLALDGGTVVIDDSTRSVSRHGMVRIAPEAIRSVRNDTDEPQTWLMIGAAAHGSIDDYGGYTMPDR